MKRFYLSIVVVIAIAAQTIGTQKAAAQEILLEGPLAGAPAVRKLVQHRQMRFSVGPQVGFTLLNDYMHNIMIGGRAEFNITDWLAIGAVGYYGANITTQLTDHIADSTNVGGTPTTPTDSNFPSYTGAENFEDQVALLKGMYLAQLSWIPLRGKMAFFDRLFVAIDGHIFAGGGLVQYKQRKDCVYDPNNTSNSTCGTPENPVVERENRFKGAFTWGLGAMLHFNDWFAVNLEYRMTPFKWNAGGTDEAGQAASEWVLIDQDEDGNDLAPSDRYWDYQPTGSDGDYPDGRIDKHDTTWNLNHSVAIGFVFYFPFQPSIAD